MRTWDQLNALTGGLGEPSKMPGHSWGISAKRCNVGSKLRLVEGSVCRNCYALKGHYVYPTVQAALERRLACWQRDREAWVEAMAESILKTKDKHFRWMDSGDLQSAEMLEDIVRVCRLVPGVRFWLPTRERALVRAHGAFPPNLVVRLSDAMVGRWSRMERGNTSGVHREEPSPALQLARGVKVCRAKERENQCGGCRACWDPRVAHVSYPLH